MTNVEEDAGRNFEDLSVRERQEALAEELKDDLQMTDEEMPEDKKLTSAKDGLADAASSKAVRSKAARPKAAGIEGEGDAGAGDRVWTPVQMADHTRMAEALLFAAAEPLDEATIAGRLPSGADIPALLEGLTAHYENRGVVLAKTSGKWRFVTAADVSHVLEVERVEQRRLSRAALETLAIIGYHQPCTRADIEDVRGVAVSIGSLDQLLEVGWVRLRGRRRNVPGRPILYGTTQKFLEHFGLEAVGDLPGMADLKAAGLLDARLPPGFSVPSPADGGGEEGDEDEGEEDGEAAEFAQDFLEEDAT